MSPRAGSHGVISRSGRSDQWRSCCCSACSVFRCIGLGMLPPQAVNLHLAFNFALMLVFLPRSQA